MLDTILSCANTHWECARAAAQQLWWQRGGGGSSAAAGREWRASRQQGGNNSTAATITRWWWWWWQCGGGVQLGSAAASQQQRSRSVASSGHGHGNCHNRRAATGCPHSGNKDTTATAMVGAQTINNQLKAVMVLATETATMTGTTMTMEIGTVAATEVRQPHGDGGSLARTWH
jgi:hypothetical protein